jgi:hypothetical protein
VSCVDQLSGEATQMDFPDWFGVGPFADVALRPPAKASRRFRVALRSRLLFTHLLVGRCCGLALGM